MTIVTGWNVYAKHGVVKQHPTVQQTVENIWTWESEPDMFVAFEDQWFEVRQGSRIAFPE
ncbi:hypothetical protein AAVH_17613 [Aphelenchoides avenae]|nr:hypothetical protein AAVH_17613 [Aphelenchus avenae]